MSEVNQPTNPPTPPSSRFQFSMASVMILVTAFCFWCVASGRPAYLREGNAGAIETGIGLLFLAAVAIGRWKVFEKAGQPGWAAVVPVYNLIVLLRVAQRPLWWVILYPIPLLMLSPLCWCHSISPDTLARACFSARDSSSLGSSSTRFWDSEPLNTGGLLTSGTSHASPMYAEHVAVEEA